MSILTLVTASSIIVEYCCPFCSGCWIRTLRKFGSSCQSSNAHPLSITLPMDNGSCFGSLILPTIMTMRTSSSAKTNFETTILVNKYSSSFVNRSCKVSALSRRNHKKLPCCGSMPIHPLLQLQLLDTLVFKRGNRRLLPFTFHCQRP